VNAAPTTAIAPREHPGAVRDATPATGTSLPEPTVSVGSPADLVATLMAMMQEMAELASTEGQARLRMTHDKLDEQLGKLMAQVAKALEAARRAQEKHHHGGWLSDLVSSVADVTGEIVGTLADFTVDSVTMPFDVAAAAAEGKNVLQAIKHELGQLATNGDTANTLKSFTAAVLKVDAALIEFTMTLGVAMAEAATNGESVWQAVKDQAGRLWDTFRQEILDNPKFWDVVGWVAKGASVAMAVMSGGTLAWLAVGVLCLSEADQRYGFIEKALGKEASIYLRLGLQLGAALLLGFAGADTAGWVRMLQGGLAVAQGGAAVCQGARTIEEGRRQAANLERQANIEATLHRMQQLQRLIDEIVADLKEDSRERKSANELVAGLAQTQAAMNGAAIMRA
jgi:hypothetical protein